MTRRLLIYAALLWLFLSLVVAGIDWQDRWHTYGAEKHYFLKLWAYWFQWGLVLPAILLIYQVAKAIRKHTYAKALMAACFSITICLAIWAGQIEPNLLVVRTQEIKIEQQVANSKQLRLAVLSDLHWGLFIRDHQINRVVQKLRDLKPDIVLIAGDFTYEPKRDLVHGFSDFRSLTMPVLAVLGNHDVEKPGPKLQRELKMALEQNGMQVIEGRALDILGWRIVGLDDLWGGKPREQISKLLIAGQTRSQPTLVLTHQPDTIALIPEAAMDLAIVGHTHGGQVVLPYLTNRVLRGTMKSNWYDGLYDTPAGQLWVTTGTGMIGLPFRFRMPPRIDLLTIKSD